MPRTLHELNDLAEMLSSLNADDLEYVLDEGYKRVNRRKNKMKFSTNRMNKVDRQDRRWNKSTRKDFPRHLVSIGRGDRPR